MDHINESEKLKKQFSTKFEETTEVIANKYPRFTNNKKDEDKTLSIAKIVVGTMCINLMNQMQVDASTLNVLDFYTKYGNAMPILEFYDFTKSQIKELINESPLNDRDKEIAYKMYAEQKTYDEIADETNIGDSKTVGNNKTRISEALKRTVMLVYGTKK